MAKKVLSKQLLLLSDLEFMLNVEDLHCRDNIELTGISGKTKTRRNVVLEKGLQFSGKNTLTSIAKEREKLLSYNDALFPKFTDVPKRLFWFSVR